MSRGISAPLARTARLLDLVPYLYSHQGISIQELATDFNVSVNQITSDLTTLWMCGLPGYTPLELIELEFESGFVTIGNASTLENPRQITFDEGLALLLGLEILKNSLPQEREDLIENANNLAELLSNKIGAPRPIILKPTVDSLIIGVITNSIKNRSNISIGYHSLYSDLISQRVVFPVEIYDSGYHLYLNAFCLTSVDVRTFRIDRIINASISDEPVPKISNSSRAEKIEFSLLIKTPTRGILEHFNLSYPDANKLWQELVVLESFSPEWILRSVLSSGSNCELVTPSTIRAQIVEMAKTMLALYRS